jgi:hypothetical protein
LHPDGRKQRLRLAREATQEVAETIHTSLHLWAAPYTRMTETAIRWPSRTRKSLRIIRLRVVYGDERCSVKERSCTGDGTVRYGAAAGHEG